MVFRSLASSFTNSRILATIGLATLLTTQDANAQGVRVQQRILAEGTAAQTPCYVLRAKKSGPTILIIGGMHGNEPAGAAAAEQIASWNIGRGTLVIVPQANALALQARKRRTPGLTGNAGDLNRAFPIGGKPRKGIATALWSLVETYKPDWVIDLHEGYDFHRSNRKSVGSSIIHSAQKRAQTLATKMIAAVDATIKSAAQRFDRIQTQVAGSLARAAWENAGIPSMIIETTTKTHALSYRVRQHRLLVHTLLHELGLTPSPPTTVLGPTSLNATPSADLLRVAVFDGGGTGKNAARHMRSVLESSDNCLVRQVGSHDIRAGALNQFDIVVHPGGSGSGQAKALGQLGRTAEVQFVRRGGGYLGVCAGAYLAAANYDWSLGLLDANVIDRKHWRRGVGPVDVEWTPAGRSSLSPGSTATTKPRFIIQYANGPIFEAAGKSELEDFETLIFFRGELTQNGAPSGVMPDTPAVVRSNFGKGRAMAFSPHPEKTAGLYALLKNSLLWLAKRQD